MLGRTTRFLLIAAVAAAGGCAAEMNQTHSPPSGVSAVDEAAFNEAVAVTAKANYAIAADEFRRLGRLFETAGEFRRAAECLFWLGYCYEKQHLPNDAEVFYRMILLKYPQTHASKEAAKRLERITSAEATPP